MNGRDCEVVGLGRSTIELDSDSLSGIINTHDVESSVVVFGIVSKLNNQVSSSESLGILSTEGNGQRLLGDGAKIKSGGTIDSRDVRQAGSLTDQLCSIGGLNDLKASASGNKARVGHTNFDGSVVAVLVGHLLNEAGNDSLGRSENSTRSLNTTGLKVDSDFTLVDWEA